MVGSQYESCAYMRFRFTFVGMGRKGCRRDRLGSRPAEQWQWQKVRAAAGAATARPNSVIQADGAAALQPGPHSPSTHSASPMHGSSPAQHS